MEQLDVIGQTYGRLTVLNFSHYTGKHRRHYLCRCSCGVEKTVQATLLRSGNTRSCGCLASEIKNGKRLPNDAGAITAILLQYKRHARDRGIEFLLTREEVDHIVRQSCYYCGIKHGNLKKTKNLPNGFPHNGIDRTNSSMPYVKDNVVPCCGVCNVAKRDKTVDEFISWIRRAADHQKAMAEQWGK